MAGGQMIGVGPPHGISRREALRLGILLVGGSATVGSLNACSSGSEPPLTVAFFGDVQDERSNVKAHETRAALDDLDPDFWIFTGDMFADVGNQRGVNQFNAVFGDLRTAGTDTIRPAAGNHDVYPNSTYFDNYWDGFLGPNNRRWFSFDLPNGWHGIVLSGNGINWPTAGSTQYQWLVDDLAANASKHTFAVYHWPRWNQGFHGPATSMGATWALFDTNPQVQFAMSGHVHTYQRFPPLTAAGAKSPDGIVQIIVPTAEATGQGRTLTDPGDLEAYGRTDDNYGGVAVRLYSNRWESRLIAGEGNPSWGPGIGDDLTTWISHPLRGGAVPPPGNLLVNPSFETNTATWGSSSATTIERVTDYAHQGSASLQVTVNATQSPRALCGVAGSDGRVAADPGHSFTVTAWFRCGSTARRLRISLIPHDSSGSLIRDFWGAWQPGVANGWAQMTQTLTMPARTESVGLWIQVEDGVAGEKFWIDEAALF
jgi:hypothetical protein